MTTQLDYVRERLAGRRVARPGPSHVIGVVSGRGGSGVSLLSAVLAIRSVRAGLKTLLVDADPWLDMQRVWLGLPKAPSLESRPAGVEELESLVTSVHGGLELLSFGSGDAYQRDRRALARRAPSVFGERDIVVVDAGSRLESLDRCVDLDVGSILIVSGCDAVGLASTHALIKAMRTRTEIVPSVVFNQVDESEALAAETVLSHGARRFLGVEPRLVGGLPSDTGVRDQLTRGATLPECLVESSLPEQLAHVMTSLRPWKPS